MAEINATEIAIQKYDLFVNGTKKEADKLFDLITEGNLKETELVRMNIKSKVPFFYKKCGEAYLILAQEKDFWGFVDVLTKKELEELIGCKIE